MCAHQRMLQLDDNRNQYRAPQEQYPIEVIKLMSPYKVSKTIQVL